MFALALAIALPGNGVRRPLDAHESFVARTAVEMERRGDFIVPYFDEQQRLQKPPLSYWFAIFSGHLCGNDASTPQTEFSARLPSIVLGASTAVLVLALGWIVFDSLLIALLAAILFATNSAYLVWSRSAQPEMAYTFSCTLFLLAAAWARREALAGRGSRRAATCAWAAVALAVMAKGPILPVLLLVAVAIALRKRTGGPGFLRTLHVPSGLLLLLALVLPYFALVVQRVPGALEFWRAQMFDRTGGLGTAWWKPLELYYVGQVIGLWMPWSLLMLLLPIWFWRTRRAGHRLELDALSIERFAGARFLGWCALVPCVALSFSAGRKGYYLLPTFPIWSLLLAWAGMSAFQRAAEHPSAARRMARGLQAHAVLFAALALALIVLVMSRQHWIGVEGALLVGMTSLLGIALVLAALGFWTASRKPALSALMLLACAALTTLAAGSSGIQSRIRLYTTGVFAREVAKITDTTRPLLVIGGDSQVLLFYTDQPVLLMEPGKLKTKLAAIAVTPWIVQNESQLRAEGVVGRVLVREKRFEGMDPMLLVDPTPAAQPQAQIERPHGSR